MNNKSIVCSVGIAFGLMTVAPALAADSEQPSYEKGPVWSIAEIQTKDGHFDDYMRWVDTGWKAQEEALKKAGKIIDYKVYVVTDPRQNEPDVLLATEFKDMASQDTPMSEIFALGKQINGSIVKSDKEEVDRGSIRTVMDAVLMREVTLK